MTNRPPQCFSVVTHSAPTNKNLINVFCPGVRFQFIFDLEFSLFEK